MDQTLLTKMQDLIDEARAQGVTAQELMQTLHERRQQQAVEDRLGGITLPSIPGDFADRIAEGIGALSDAGVEIPPMEQVYKTLRQSLAARQPARILRGLCLLYLAVSNEHRYWNQ
jgi:hypothetical protein